MKFPIIARHLFTPPRFRRLVASAALAASLALPLRAPADDGHAHEHDHDEHDAVETIVVTASPLEHERDELAIPVDRLRRDDIIEQLGATIGDTLRNVPGVSQSGFTGGSSRPVIRGQDAFRTEVLESGLATHDVSRLSPDHAVPVNPLAASAIEIVRGPGVLRYGGGASAGVVNVITNRVPSRLLDEPLIGEALGVYGTNGDERDFALSGDGGFAVGDGGFGWHVDGLRRKSDDYENGAGERQTGTFTDTTSGSLGGSAFFRGHRLGLAYSRYDSEYGIPEEDPVRIDMRTNRFRLEGDLDEPLAGLREIRFRGVWSDYRHDELADGAVGQTFDNDELDARLELLHEPLAGFIGAWGVHGRHQDFRAGGEAEEFLAPSKTSSAAFYLFEEVGLTEAVHTEWGLRVERAWVDGMPAAGGRTEKTFTPLSGSAALIAEPALGWSIGLIGVAGQRAPSQVELFARGPHEATGTFEVGEPDLDEETSYTGEIRLTRSTGRVRFETAAFVTHYDGFIFGELTGVAVDEEGDPIPDVDEEGEGHDAEAEAGGHGHDGPLDQLFYRARDARFLGAEATATIDLFELLGGRVSTEWQIDWVEARFTAGGADENVPRIPPVRWGGRLAYAHGRANARFGFLRAERQRNVSSGELSTESFTMLEASARYRLPLPFENRTPISLTLSARNLLDEEARNAASFTKDEVLLPGQTIRTGLHIEF